MIKKLSIPITIVLAGLIIAGAVIFINLKGEKSSPALAQQMAEKALNYINENLLGEGMTAVLVEATKEGELVKMKLKIGENEFDSYATLDGKYLFPDAFNMEEELPAPEEQTPPENQPQEIPKADIPDVKLFVMSYCPFGLQAQKGFLPVYNLLKDKAKMGVYFVNYIMHEKIEIDENLRQYCIQKQDPEKYADYLSCFVKDGKSDQCLSNIKIDESKLNSCISETDKEYKISENYNDKNTWLNGIYPKFDVHTDLNEKYGVGGSPTFVINDVVVQISRSPEEIKKAVCKAFNSEPEECSQNLSTDTPSSGFGEGTGASSEGGCE